METMQRLVVASAGTSGTRDLAFFACTAGSLHPVLGGSPGPLTRSNSPQLSIGHAIPPPQPIARCSPRARWRNIRRGS
jgi:hypothetical protein